MQNDIRGAADAGYVLDQPRIDPVKRKGALDKVVELANAGREGIECLGRFSIARARADDDQYYFTQIRAVPTSVSSGCEFRFDVPAWATGDEEIEVIAADLLDDARSFCRLTNIDAFTNPMLQIVETIIARTSDGLTPMRLLSYGITMGKRGNVMLTLDLETIGDDLRIGVDRIHVVAADEIGDRLTAVVEQHKHRQSLRDMAKASRALGWIDHTALAILDASGLPHRRAFALLQEREEVEFSFGGADAQENHASLFWEEGVIYGSVASERGTSRLYGKQLILANAGLPGTVLASWPGCRFGDVATHPYVPADALVTSAVTIGELLYIQTVVPTSLIDENGTNVRAGTRVS